MGVSRCKEKKKVAASVGSSRSGYIDISVLPEIGFVIARDSFKATSSILRVEDENCRALREIDFEALRRSLGSSRCRGFGGLCER